MAAADDARSAGLPPDVDSTPVLARRPTLDRARVVWTSTRLLGFVVTSVVMAVPRTSFTSSIAGNPGDAFLLLRLIRWGAERSSSFYEGYWAGPFFAPARDTMAFTDTFLPLTIPYRIIWEVTGSPVVAMNLLYLAGWVLCCECTYHLLLRVTESRSASVVGALAFTFSTIRIAQTGHFQLVFIFFVPLAFVALARLIQRPTVLGGLGLALIVAGQFLTSAYYGVVLAVAIGIVSVVALIARWSSPQRRRLLGAYAVTGVVCAAVVGPIALRYKRVQEEIGSRDTYPGYFALRPGDLLAAAPNSRYLRHIGILNADVASRSSESYAYVGLFVIVMVPVFILLVARSASFRARLSRHRWELATAGIAGLIGFGIAYGRGSILGLSSPFYDIARRTLPGIRPMLAIVRQFVFTQLALVMYAAVAFGALLTRTQKRRTRVVAATAVSLAILVESLVTVQWTQVPEVEAGSVYDVLGELPDRDCAVAELPVSPKYLGGVTAYIEGPRMVLNANGELRTVNGHSGYAPSGYDELATTLNTFPSAESRAALEWAGACYVVLHTAPLDTGDPATSRMVNESGWAYFEQGQLDNILALLPPEAVSRRIDANDGIVLELSNAPLDE